MSMCRECGMSYVMTQLNMVCLSPLHAVKRQAQTIFFDTKSAHDMELRTPRHSKHSAGFIVPVNQLKEWFIA